MTAARGASRPHGAALGPRRDYLALGAIALAAIALRLVYRIDYDEDLDALRFRLGVEHFDPGSLRPHAPFYPVYIAAAKIVVLLGGAPRTALAIVSAISGAALVVFVGLLAFELLGRRAAAIAAALALSSPFLWLTSEKLTSDMPGAALISAALWLLARAHRDVTRASALRTIALVILGLELGVRLSYFPFAVVAMLVVARSEGGGVAYLARARDLAAGVVPWLVPLVIVTGPRALVAMTIAQGHGHFTRWGGSVITVSSPIDRLSGIGWGLWANLLGGAFPDASLARWIGAPLLVLFLALALRRASYASSSAQPELVLGAAAYLAWAALGQNVAYKPRHLLPLAPLLLVALARGAEILATRVRGGIAASALLAAQWFTDGAGLAAEHRAPSPAAAIAAFVHDAHGARPVLTLEVGRLIADVAPDTRLVEGDEAVDQSILDLPSEGAWITSEALSSDRMRALAAMDLELGPVFVHPRSRYVDPLWCELGLYAIRARR